MAEMILSKERIKKSFSKCAKVYDKVSDFQKETGYKLIREILLDKVVNKDFILDIGMGSGNITEELSNRLNKSIYGCDIAWGMVSFSKENRNGLYISQGDAENLPFKEGIFDICFSNITYQWVSNFKKAFLEVRRVLKKEGRFYFTILVRDSLKELYKTVEVVVKRNFNGDFLPTGEFIKSKLKDTDLNLIWYEERTIKRYYANSLELLRALKKAGAGKILEDNVFGMGKRRLFFDLLKTYDENYAESNKVFATYKVVFGCAKK